MCVGILGVLDMEGPGKRLTTKMGNAGLQTKLPYRMTIILLPTEILYSSAVHQFTHA